MEQAHEAGGAARGPASDIDEQRTVAEAAREHVGDQGRGAGSRGVEPGVQGPRPIQPGRGGQLQEDLLAGLEVAQQGRLVDADPRGDIRQAHVADAVAQRQLAGGGHIIQVSSIGGRLATAGLPAYQAAKWAVGGFSEVLAKEVSPFGIKVTVLEPGGMRTDWAGSSMRVPPVSEPYQPTVGAMARLHHDLGSASALGDPAKVARVVLEVAGMAEPPLRLILGSEAYAYAMAAARERAEADAAWHDLTVSTDRDDATAAHRDPLGAASSA